MDKRTRDPARHCWLLLKSKTGYGTVKAFTSTTGYTPWVSTELTPLPTQATRVLLQSGEGPQ